jgi:hypothetical protein
VQLLFSLEYDPEWAVRFDLPRPVANDHPHDHRVRGR